MFVFVKIWDCHENRLRAGLAVCMPLTEAWTRTYLTGRCGRIVALSDENRGTSGVRSPDERSNKSRTTSCRSGSSCAVWVSSRGTGFPTLDAPLLTGSHAAGRQVATQWDCSVGTRRRFRNELITCKLHGLWRRLKTVMTSPGPSLAAHLEGPGPSANLAVPPVGRVPCVTRLLSMIKGRSPARRPLQLTALCEVDRDE